MASNSQGIQQLLAAEKSAAEKVSAARKREYTLCMFQRKRVCATYAYSS